MRGHIKPRMLRDGRRVWDLVVELPRKADGRRNQKWIRGFATRREAESQRTEILGTLDRGTYAEPTRQTFAEYVTEWLAGRNLRSSTQQSYAGLMNRHVIPRIGGIRLQQLTPEALEKVYREMVVSGLSPRTAAYTHTVIRKALADAVKRGRLPRNVADLVERPRSRSPEMKTWTAAELRYFLNVVREERLYAAWLLLATTGLRRGELLGLRWNDVDFEAGRIAIRQTLVNVGYRVETSEPKTHRGRRSVAIDPTTVAALRDHRKKQLEERLAWGARWEDSGLVFTRENGSLVHPDTFSGMFERLVRKSDLPRIRLHDLRHTYATLALSAGVHPKVVSERLGHASISITLDTYSHAIPALEEKAASLVAGIILGGGKT